jgi:ubiquinone/menaquinone biosynthesis C-methylase UbiE
MPAAWIYDLFMAPLERLALRRARARLVAGLEGRTLELGAGTGLQFPAYQRVRPAAALDIDLAALRRARRRDPRVPLVCADAQALPFRGGAFDAVVESLSFCSILDPALALDEVRRVLRSGGELRMLEHVRPPGRTLGRLFDWLTPAWSRISGGCRLNRRTANAVRAAGFELTSVREALRGASLRLRARRP